MPPVPDRGIVPGCLVGRPAGSDDRRSLLGQSLGPQFLVGLHGQSNPNINGGTATGDSFSPSFMVQIRYPVVYRPFHGLATVPGLCDQHGEKNGSHLLQMSTRVSREEVEHVGELARLQLSQEELEQFSSQLSRIVTYMEEVNAVDTTGVPGTTSMVADGGTNVWRDDEVRPSLSREQAVGNAPEAADGLFRVPQVISDR